MLLEVCDEELDVVRNFVLYRHGTMHASALTRCKALYFLLLSAEWSQTLQSAFIFTIPAI
jgi:hypothetical protein